VCDPQERQHAQSGQQHQEVGADERLGSHRNR
jgi:hypothetical protein